MSESFNTLYKEFRNRLRPFQPQSVLAAAMSMLRQPAKDRMEDLERLPWQIMLIVKWALQDDMCSDVHGRLITQREFDELRQSLLEFPERMDRLASGPLWLWMRRLLHQQLAFQRRTSGGFAREAALLGSLTEDHPLRRLFKEKTALTPEQFLDLSLATYSAILEGQLSLPVTWFATLRPSTGDPAIRAFISLVSRTYPELRRFCRELPHGDERKASEFFEFTPLHRFPFVRRGNVLECWHPMVFYRAMESMVHSVLSEAGPAYIQPFSRLFEAHIRTELRSTGSSLVDENDLRAMLSQDMQVPDALLSFSEANVFVEAKAGLFDESVMVAGDAKILSHKTRALQKAIGQGWSASTGVRRSAEAPAQIREAPTDYLLVVTNRELNSSRGSRLRETYPAGTLEYPNADAQRLLPLDHVYVLSVDDFERVVAAITQDHLHLPTLLSRCVQCDAAPETARFFFHQHLDAFRIKEGRSVLIDVALDAVIARYEAGQATRPV